MRRRIHTFLATVVLMLALGPATAAAACPDTDLQPGPSTIEREARATLCLINAQRTSRGLPALAADPRLTRAARAHAIDMVRRSFFSHVAPGGATMTQRVARTGYLRGARAWALSENIAWGAGTESTPTAIVTGWMESPPHRAAILDGRFRDLGIGVALGVPLGPPDGTTITADFGGHTRRHRMR
jgi:uncharacterized protein YkwD